MLDWLTSKAHALVQNDSSIEVIEKAATNGAYLASGATIFSGLTVNEWGVVVGMILGFATFGFNVWFKMKYGRGSDE